MANYQLNSLCGTSGINDEENFPREGRVNEVCREWLLHEDLALAYRLQSEEYKHHLGNNKERNALLRQDTPRAKEEQFKEDEEAARTQNAIEAALAEQEAKDAALAAAIAADIELKEIEQQKLLELKDMELAKKLLAQDKAKIRHMKEIRNSKAKSANQSTTRDLSDLSDFCIKPEYPMDEEEERLLQEEQDEELARLLQEQDLKRRGDLLQEDQLSAIEAQDKELAKILQEQEKAKAKKAREKARQKALLGNQQRQPDKKETRRSLDDQETLNMSFDRSQHSDSPEVSHYASINPPDRRMLSPHHQRSPSPPTQRPPSPQYATPILKPRVGIDTIINPLERHEEINMRNHGRERDFLEDSSVIRAGSSRMLGKDFERSDINISPPRQNFHNVSPSRNFSSPGGFTNIACAIDPTYERRVKSGEFTASQVPLATISPSYINSAESPVSPSSCKYSHNTGSSTSSSNGVYRNSYLNSPISPAPHLTTPVFDDEDEYLPPPYMPIQGQRRTESLEKRKVVSKLSKEKPPKDGGCKQQ